MKRIELFINVCVLFAFIIEVTIYFNLFVHLKGISLFESNVLALYYALHLPSA
jgi:hypothetical protein